ncbi:hypothetical protein CKO15_10650 [Halorhodospira abdelmalekii]|uniref:UvrD-helicase domain-containing protein n=1 Tax=Halorhodospira abdelmalekii TaxID=421629 RepID=UPI0019032F1D|nr:UvrD-helicase domain-containing protein [Halorhodospira abdelmalekii]MBK1735731.1 hypothetical protein [Halorhodospira abdelmalekii]
MRVLLYNELQPEKIRGFDKVREALELGDFRRADVRKIDAHLYRARLNRSDRLLFTLRRVHGEVCCLILEYIPNHAYDKSRFLSGGAVIDDEKIPAIEDPDALEASPSTHLNPAKPYFNLLDKALTFDDEQETVYATNLPLVIIGSAGSGKTALALEKMKQFPGEGLYITLSAHLVQHARALYFANAYSNDAQQIEFLSFNELLESIQIPEGREVTLSDFRDWFERQPLARTLGAPDPVFEEIRGVLTGSVAEQRPWLTRAEYRELGIRQSIFGEEQREQVYDLFERYLRWLGTVSLYDTNILSHRYRERLTPRYDFIIVDEVQDLTYIQLHLILRALRAPGAFLLCGDANQIVHPNFFSWAQIKQLLFHDAPLHSGQQVLHVLHSNYRNAHLINELANRLLKVKRARFGAIDRESSRLVHSTGLDPGQLQLLPDTAALKRELNERTGRSARVAVLVMHPEQKAAARAYFETPLIFSIQEAKGIEYDSVILLNFISDEAETFRTIAAGVAPADLEEDDLAYARPRDKRDTSLTIYKFYINALYVAVTRAVRKVYWLEAHTDHPLLELLGLTRFAEEAVHAETEDSSLERWQREAQRLELQGKREQASEIRERLLQQPPPPWSVLDRDGFTTLRTRAFEAGIKKERLELFEYALLHCHLPTTSRLAREHFGPALQPEQKALQQVHRNHLLSYSHKNIDAVLKQVERHGTEHRTRYHLTPLMAAAHIGNTALIGALMARGADPEQTADHGFTPLHFALEQAYLDPGFAAQRLAPIYRHLVPLNLSIQVNGQLLKLDRLQMEFFLLQWLSALFYRGLGPLLGHGAGGFSPEWIKRSLAVLPAEILPESCKDADFIGAVLANNEFRRRRGNNYRLFRRTTQDYYVINPGVRLRTRDGLIAYYDLFRPEDLDPGVTPQRLQDEGYGKVPETDEDLAALHRQRDQYVAIFRTWLREQTRTWATR